MTSKTLKPPKDKHKWIKDEDKPKEKHECPICQGRQYLPMGNNNEYRRPCVCTLRRIYEASLGREIYNARPLEESPYTNKVRNSLFIKANRRDILPHIRHALICQGTKFFHRITNDSALMDAWLAKDKESSKEEGSTSVTYTSLRDLVEDPKLLILFLGVMSYSNRALPGVLLEALRIREFAGKPTWVIASHQKPFVQGHLAYSPEGEEYLVENFELCTITPSKPGKSLYEGVVSMDNEDQDTGQGDPEAKKSRHLKHATRDLFK